jgi:hypothetical protein
MALENPSISSRASKARSTTSDQTLRVMHPARVSRPALHTETDEVAVQEALLTGQG